jgi:hypothetical protein
MHSCYSCKCSGSGSVPDDGSTAENVGLLHV